MFLVNFILWTFAAFVALGVAVTVFYSALYAFALIVISLAELPGAVWKSLKSRGPGKPL